jgi:hypothetical protein
MLPCTGVRRQCEYAPSETSSAVQHSHRPAACHVSTSARCVRHRAGFPDVDDRHIPLLVAKLFLDALFAYRQALLIITEERDSEAEAARQGTAEEEAECASLREQKSRKARTAEKERLFEEDRRKAQEAHRLAMEQEERRSPGRVSAVSANDTSRGHANAKLVPLREPTAKLGPSASRLRENLTVLSGDDVPIDPSVSVISRGP